MPEEQLNVAPKNSHKARGMILGRESPKEATAISSIDSALHKHAHQVDGLIGSLDCSHTMWKSCPGTGDGGIDGSNAGTFVEERRSASRGRTSTSRGRCLWRS